MPGLALPSALDAWHAVHVLAEPLCSCLQGRDCQIPGEGKVVMSCPDAHVHNAAMLSACLLYMHSGISHRLLCVCHAAQGRLIAGLNLARQARLASSARPTALQSQSVCAAQRMAGTVCLRQSGRLCRRHQVHACCHSCKGLQIR